LIGRGATLADPRWSLPALRVRGTCIATNKSAPVTTWISFRRHARTTVDAAELLAQFCANQLVRRAIGGACEKYFPGVTRPWIVSARASSGSPAWRARVASHAGGMQQDCIKHGIFL
jgi:hypothetical protein